MATYVVQKLSGSTDGKQIKVAAVGTPGTLIHTAQASANDEDFLFVSAVNSSAASVKLTLEHGGVAVPDDIVEITIPPETGLIPIYQGIPLRNSLVLRAFAATANVILINGYAVKKTT
jgi:hypothetical protein